MDQKLSDISTKVSLSFKDINEKAKKALSIMVCGSYKDESDLRIIEKFRDQQREKGVTGTFLMTDIITEEKELPLHEKFHHLWLQMKKDDKVPLFIIFAGKSASESLGLNAEIQTIAYDKEKISCAHLFKFPGINLVSHETCFAFTREVRTHEEFIEEAEKVVNNYVNQIRMFYQAK